jgi:hypothetical protein
MSARHDCPGGCGQKVDRGLFACAKCWWRLPIEHRDAINDAYPRRHFEPLAHRQAMAEALRWYKTAGAA